MASLQGMVRTNLAVRQGEVARFATELNDSFHALTASEPVCDALLRCRRRFQPNAPLCQRRPKSPASIQERHVAGDDQSTTESLECGGPPIGILARSQYRSEHVPLHAGDVLVAYTDGVVEALNPQQEEFGEERLSDIVRSSLSLSAEEICKRIAERLQAFVAESPQWDDITLVVMKVKPE